MKRFASFRLDTANVCLWREGQRIDLPPKPFAVLRYLVEHAGRLIPHDELLDAVWPETYVQPQVLRTYMLELRKILGDNRDRPCFIQTLPRRGHRFVAEVSDDAAQPTAVEQAGAALLVGRERELQALQAHLRLASAGRRQMVVVSGEAGIGKTALLDEFCRQAAEHAGIAQGHSVKGLSGVERYYPLTEAVRGLREGPVGDAWSSVLEKRAPGWAGTQAGSEALPGDLCAALEEFSAARPVIVALEDVHWADEATLHFLSAIARRRAPAKLLVVVTCLSRDKGEEPRFGQVMQDLLVHGLMAGMRLERLSRTAIAELVSRKLEQPAPPEGLAAFVHQHSQGNPLFAIALLEHLVAHGFLVRIEREGAQVWERRNSLEEADASVPAGLAQMIELEIQGLPAEDQRLLEAASLMGIAFPAWAVAAALTRETAAAEEACDALARRLHFLERGGEDELPDGTRSSFYVFAHELYREVLYRRQNATRRAAGHVRIAERMSEAFAGRTENIARELAMHYEAGHDRRRAAAALHAAALYATQRKAHSEAAELLERGRSLAEHLPEPQRTTLLRELDGDKQPPRASSKAGRTVKKRHKKPDAFLTAT